MKRINIELAKTIAGVLLVGAGILIFRQHLNQTMTQLNNVPAGMLPVVIMGKAQQTWQSSGTGFLLQRALGHMLVALWPLLLVRIGMGLSTECRREP